MNSPVPTSRLITARVPAHITIPTLAPSVPEGDAGPIRGAANVGNGVASGVGPGDGTGLKVTVEVAPTGAGVPVGVALGGTGVDVGVPVGVGNAVRAMVGVLGMGVVDGVAIATDRPTANSPIRRSTRTR